MLPDFLTNPDWLSALSGLVSALIAVLGLWWAIVSLLYRPWKRRKERHESDHRIVLNLIRFLEDRRALYSRWADEQPEMVISSVRDIRRRLTADIEKLEERSAALPYLMSMQAACRRFLTPVEAIPQDQHDLPYPHEGLLPIFTSLSELRTVFGVQMDHLRRLYSIEKGPPPDDPNPFIGRRIRRTIRIPPTNWQPKKEPEGDKQ